MKYKVVEKRGREDLEKEVNNLLSDGWEPVGGIDVFHAPNGVWWYFQAMIKR